MIYLYHIKTNISLCVFDCQLGFITYSKPDCRFRYYGGKIMITRIAGGFLFRTSPFLRWEKLRCTQQAKAHNKGTKQNVKRSCLIPFYRLCIIGFLWCLCKSGHLTYPEILKTVSTPCNLSGLHSDMPTA